MKALLFSALMLLGVSVQAAALLSSAPYGMNQALLAPWQNNANVVSVTATCVNLAAIDGTSVSVSIYGFGNFTFTGTKTTGDGTLTSDYWYGTSGTSTLSLVRSGEHLGGNMFIPGALGDGLVGARYFQVARFDSTCAGALVEQKAPHLRTFNTQQGNEF